jgi:5-methylcytosine-specific restriction endonuclease McrA
MEQTLLLNATYEPLRVVHWQKAITLWCQGKVEIVAHYDREIRSVSFSMRLPSVIRLLRRIRVRRSVEYVPFSRANIYARDNHSCQYCGDVLASSELTFDHVVPVAQGGRKDWEKHRHLLHQLQQEEGRTHARAGGECTCSASEAAGPCAGHSHHVRPS